MTISVPTEKGKTMGKLSEYGAEIGMRVTCQRCGFQTFRKQTGYNNVDAAIANRHSFLDQFEPMPEGWKIKHEVGGWLCHQCVEKYDSIFQAFMAQKQAFMEGGADNA